MVAIRTTLRLFVALAAAVAVSASFYDDEDSLDLRELGLDYQVPFARGFSDGDDFILTARDLELMGVRSDDISHVLVVRASPRGSRSPSPKGASKADLERQLKVHKDGLKSAKAKVKECKDKIKSVAADKKEFWKKELKSANEMVSYENEEIHEYEELIKHAK